MKLIHIILLFFLSNYLNAQNFLISYERITYEEFENGVTKICPTLLYTNIEESIFLEDRVINGYSTEVSLKKYRSKDTLGIKIKGDEIGQIIHKKFDTNTYKQRRRVAGYKNQTYGLVIDSILPDFLWVLKNEYKEILGFKVQKATSTFLGRAITAWFTSDLSISDGPWKFSNLPGLILMVEIKLNEESYLVYEAVSLKQIEKFPNFNFTNTPNFSLEEIHEFYLKKYENQFKYYRTKTNGEIKLRKDDLDFEPIIFKSN